MKKININREVVIVSLLLFILAGPMFGPVPQYLLETLKLFVRETSGWLLVVGVIISVFWGLIGWGGMKKTGPHASILEVSLFRFYMMVLSV